MDSDSDRPIERPAPSDYSSVKYAVAVLLVAGALVTAAVTGMFNGATGDTAANEQPTPAATADANPSAKSDDSAAKAPEATPPTDAANAPAASPDAAPGANTGASSGEAGSDTPPAGQPAPGATQPEAGPSAPSGETPAEKPPAQQ